MNKSSHSSKKNLRSAYVIAGIAILCLLCIACFVFFINRDPGSLGTVNESPFYNEELALYAEEQRSRVSSQFSQKYDLPGTGPAFWTTEYDGVLPVDTLIEYSMENLVRNKVLQQECVARGIVAPLDFRELQKSLAAENDSRSDTLEQGGFVYGTKQYTLSQYNDYQMTMASDVLKGYLLENDLAPSEEQLRSAFDSLDESFKRKDFTAKGYVFLWDMSGDLTAGQAAIEQALESGILPENIPEHLADSVLGLIVDVIDLDTASRSKDDTFSDILTQELFDLEPGACRSALVDGSNMVYYLTEKNGGGYYTFEEAPGLAENKYINDAFEDFLASRIAEAHVELDLEKARTALLEFLQ